MGLLDHRESPGYSPKMDKFMPIYNFASKFMSIRKSKVVPSSPIMTTRLYAYHLLVQQGLPGNVKVVVVLLSLATPIITLQLLSSKYHPHWKDSLRV
jgi:hypothetical protein